MRIAWALSPAALAAGLFAPAAAHGVVVTGVSSTRITEAMVEVEDSMGGDDDLQITMGYARIIVRQVGGAAIEAKGRCERGSDAVAVCELSFAGLEIQAGAGDDRVNVRVRSDQGVRRVYGGPGRDTLAVWGEAGGELRGGGGNDHLSGGEGRDWLAGGPGRDRLEGRRGSDFLFGQGGDDLLLGGTGKDVASWWNQDEPVSVNLGAGTATTAGSDDTLISIERADGGNGADRFVGDDGPNRFRGYKGDDILIGAGGNDRLGPGSGDHDRSRCGTGIDHVNSPGRRPLRRDCEWIYARATLGEKLHVQPEVISPTRWNVAVVGDLSASNNRRRVILYVARTEVGRSNLVRLRRNHETVPVQLRRPIRRGEVVRVHIKGTGDYSDDSAPTNAPLITYGYSFSYWLRR